MQACHTSLMVTIEKPEIGILARSRKESTVPYATTIQISHTTRSCPSSENLFISRRARRTPSADSNSQNPNPFGEPVVGSCARFQLLICPHSYTRDSQKKSEIQQQNSQDHRIRRTSACMGPKKHTK